jgi:hypothetical protein
LIAAYRPLGGKPSSSRMPRHPPRCTMAVHDGARHRGANPA